MSGLKFINNEEEEDIGKDFKHADGELEDLISQEEYTFDLGPVADTDDVDDDDVDDDDSEEEEGEVGFGLLREDVEQINAWSQSIRDRRTTREALEDIATRIVHMPPTEILMYNHFMVEFPNNDIPYNQVRSYKFSVSGRQQEMTIELINTLNYQISLTDARSVNLIKVSLIKPDHDPIRETRYQASELKSMIQKGDYNSSGLGVVELIYNVSELND